MIGEISRIQELENALLSILDALQELDLDIEDEFQDLVDHAYEVLDAEDEPADWPTGV